MTAVEMVLQIASVLENSPALVEFCSGHGLDSHSVFYPADDQDPLGAEAAPWIELDPESGSGGVSAEETVVNVGLDVGIFHEDPQTGMRLADDFYRAVIAALVRSGIDPERVGYFCSFSDAAPLRMIFSTISVTNPRALGRENVI